MGSKTKSLSCCNALTLERDLSIFWEERFHQLIVLISLYPFQIITVASSVNRWLKKIKTIISNLDLLLAFFPLHFIQKQDVQRKSFFGYDRMLITKPRTFWKNKSQYSWSSFPCHSSKLNLSYLSDKHLFLSPNHVYLTILSPSVRKIEYIYPPRSSIRASNLDHVDKFFVLFCKSQFFYAEMDLCGL